MWLFPSLDWQTSLGEWFWKLMPSAFGQHQEGHLSFHSGRSIWNVAIDLGQRRFVSPPGTHMDLGIWFFVIILECSLTCPTDSSWMSWKIATQLVFCVCRLCIHGSKRIEKQNVPFPNVDQHVLGLFLKLYGIQTHSFPELPWITGSIDIT